MKAQSQLLSHMIYIVLGFAAITLIFFSLSNLSSNVKNTSMELQAEYVAEAVKDRIISLYSVSENSNFVPGQSAVLGVYDLNLPEKISQKKYTVLLSKNTITVKVDTVEIKRSVNIDVNLDGFSSIPAYLELKRVNQNGIPVDTISLVNK